MMNKIFFITIVLSCFHRNFCLYFQYRPFTIIAHENQWISIPCFLHINNTSTQWIKYETDLQPFLVTNDSEHVISQFGIMTKRINAAERSLYQCALRSNNEIAMEKMVQIDVMGLGNILSNYEGSFFDLVDPLTFRTKLVTGNDRRLVWLIWVNHRVYNIGISDLAILRSDTIIMDRFPSSDDVGIVACLASSNNLSTCDQVRLIRKSKLATNPKLFYASVGDIIILKCDDNNSGNQRTWFKDGKQVKFDKKIKNYGKYIRMENITRFDFGRYECITQKPSLMPSKLSIFLIDFYNSTYLFHSITSSMEKSSVGLPCSNSEGETPHYSTVRRVNIFNQIPDVSHWNVLLNSYIPQGLYQCMILQGRTLDVYSYYKYRYSKVQSQPMKRGILRQRRSIDNQEIVLDYKFTSFTDNIKISWSPPPIQIRSYTFHWGELYPGPKKQVIDGKETKFVIESLNQETNYFIKIEADAVNGTIKSSLLPITTKKENKEIVLTIPVNLKPMEVGDIWARISWDHRENPQSINKTIYQVEYYPVRGQLGNKNHLNTTSTTLKITDISPATTYEIMVRSCLRNSSKCSDWSMVLEFTTQETKPSDPPQHLTLSTIHLKPVPSDNSLNKHIFAVQVSWQPPKKPNGEIKNYLILVTADKKLETDNWGERTVSGKTLNTVIDRLDLNRYYYFRIGCSNEYGKSPFSSIRIFKTPDENGKNGGPINLSKEYYDAMEINEELKIQTSNERGTDNLPDINSDGLENRNNHKNKISLTNSKWWIIITAVVIFMLLVILVIVVYVATKCRNETIPYENGMKVFKAKNQCDIDYRKQTNEVVKFVNKTPILTTPDLFRHTNDQNCHQNYLEMEDRTESPNSFSSNKGFPSQSHNAPFSSQQGYRGIPGHYTPPGLIHQQNIVMTSSQLTSNSNDRQFYQVPFLHHHMGHNPLNVFTSSAPRVNAASSDFNSINIPSPISGYSDFTSSQATVLYDTSTAKSSGGKSSLSGSGSYNNGLGHKNSLINEPISEGGYNSPDLNHDIKNSKSIDPQHLISKAFSSEELSQEMANLEGLMKDLNSITQKEFEC